MVTKEEIKKVIQSRKSPIRLKTLCAVLEAKQANPYCGYFSAASLSARVKTLLREMVSHGELSEEKISETIIIHTKPKSFYGTRDQFNNQTIGKISV